MRRQVCSTSGDSSNLLEQLMLRIFDCEHGQPPITSDGAASLQATTVAHLGLVVCGGGEHL